MAPNASSSPCSCSRFTTETPDCPIHPLRNDPVVKALYVACENGNPYAWANIVWQDEMATQKRMSPTEIIEKEKAIIRDDENRAENIKKYMLQKEADIHVNSRTGDLKFTSGKVCRDAEEPAKWVHGSKKLGNLRTWQATDPKATKKPTIRPAGVPPDAIFWMAGCEPHMKGCCPHLHPDQPNFAEAKANGGRIQAGAQQIISKACYLSNKPAPKPQGNFRMLDAW